MRYTDYVKTLTEKLTAFGDEDIIAIYDEATDTVLGIKKSVLFSVIHLLDGNYTPFAGSFTSDNPFSIGSNDNVQNNAGVIVTADNYFAAAIDTKLNASGANKLYTGLLTQLKVGGAYTGNPTLRGHWIQVNNRLNTGEADSQINGIDASVSLEGKFTEGVGALIGVFRGGTGGVGDKITGMRLTAGNGYLPATEVNVGEFIARTISVGSVIGLSRSVWAKWQNVTGHTIEEARLIDLSGSTNGGTIENSVGIYANENIDTGTLSRFFIKSDSNSPSKLAGTLESPNNISQFITVETDGGDLLMTQGSPRTWELTGDLTQSFILPNPQACATGQRHVVINNSIVEQNVLLYTEVLLATLPPMSTAEFICRDNINADNLTSWQIERYTPEGKGLTFLGGVPQIEQLGKRITLSGALAIGNNDVYQVPADYQFLTRSIFEYGNMAGYTIYSGVKIATDYYRLGSISAIAANASRLDSYAFAYESGETLFINSTAAAKYIIDGFLIPNSSVVNIKRPMVTSQTATTNTLLYTVPTGKRAFVLNGMVGANFATSAGWAIGINDSGTNGTAQFYYVPSGQSVGAGFLAQQNITMNTANVGQTVLLPPYMKEGDSIWYQTSIANAGQTFYAIIVEFDK